MTPEGRARGMRFAGGGTIKCVVYLGGMEFVNTAINRHCDQPKRCPIQLTDVMMLPLEGNEEMGLESSLRLLDLPMEATIDDVNAAYERLHRMIDQYYQDAGAAEQGERQADMDLLALAYENAVAYLSGQDDDDPLAPEPMPASSRRRGADLRIVNLPAEEPEDEEIETVSSLPDSNIETVEAALAVISQRLHETEAALPDAQRDVDSATTALEAANRHHERVRQESINTIVAAKSAKIRALLLEIEAKRAMEKAVAIAEKARARVTAAKRMAKEAKTEAEKARQEVGRLKASEESAAAEALNAEKQLEAAKGRLKTLTNNLMETRKRIRLSQDVIETESGIERLLEGTGDLLAASSSDTTLAAERQKIINDLTEIENSLNGSKERPVAARRTVGPNRQRIARDTAEKRSDFRIVYPADQRPVFSIDGRTMPVLDLSSAGMRLKISEDRSCPRIMRGVIGFNDRPPLKVTGRVVRQGQGSVGLRLVTRIGNHVLDQERMRLSA